ncbi:MAG: hypothetical protein QOE00_574, partial [Ilumatobacteraceae bacterium]
ASVQASRRASLDTRARSERIRAQKKLMSAVMLAEEFGSSG